MVRFHKKDLVYIPNSRLTRCQRTLSITMTFVDRQSTETLGTITTKTSCHRHQWRAVDHSITLTRKILTSHHVCRYPHLASQPDAHCPVPPCHVVASLHHEGTNTHTLAVRFGPKFRYHESQTFCATSKLHLDCCV